MRRVLLPVLLLAALALPAGAQERDGEEDIEAILGGFDTPAPEAGKDAESDGEGGAEFGGRLRLASSYNTAHDRPAEGSTDWRGLSKLRLEIELEADVALGERWRLFGSGHAFRDLVFDLRDGNGYTPETLDALQDEVELDETFVAGRLGRGFHLTVGRRIVVWGTSETVRVTDVLNPLDLREPGLTDIEDLRLPVVMSRLDWAKNRWTLSGLAIHEIRFDKNPPWGSDFYPSPVPLQDAVEPESNYDNTEWALSARGAFRGWDLDLYWAEIWDDRTHFEQNGPWPWNLERRHSRLTMAGAALAATAGDWLLKAEAAHFNGLEFFSAPDRDFARTDAMAGLEYFGWNDTSLTIEAVNRHLHGFEPGLEAPPDFAEEDRFEWVVRLGRFFLNQTLALNYVALVAEADGSGGSIQRLEARYDVNDRVEIVGGLVLYQNGDAPVLGRFGDNDRLFFEAAYRF